MKQLLFMLSDKIDASRILYNNHSGRLLNSYWEILAPDQTLYWEGILGNGLEWAIEWDRWWDKKAKWYQKWHGTMSLAP